MKKTIIFIHCFLIIPVLITFSLFIANIDFSLDNKLLIASIMYTLFSIWVIFSWRKVTSSLFNPYILFMVATILFNGGQAFLRVTSGSDFIFLRGMLNEKIVLDTLVYVTIAISFFHLGGLLSLLKKTKRKPTLIKEKNIRLIGWGLFFISFIPSIIVLKDAVLIVLQGGYTALYGRENVATSFNAIPEILSSFLVPAVMFILAGSKGNRRNITLSLLLILTYSFTQFLLGSRSSAVMPLISFFWLWDRHIKKIPRVIITISGISILVIIFPLISLIRNVTGEDKFSLSFIINTFTTIENPLNAILYEMGNSMNTIAYTINFVPDLHNYDLGIGYFYALLTAFPNLFWDIHPTVAHGLYANWLVWLVDPTFAARGGGLGYSFLAEAFINFGYAFSLLFLVLLGFLLGKFVAWGDDKSSPAKLATLAIGISFLLFLARGETASYVRPILWYTIIPYVALLELSKIKRFNIKE